MNIIKTKVDFTKGTCTVSGINLVEGDYNSTKIEFTFDREDGTKVFEMKSPSEQLVAYQEIYNNEIILYGLKDVTTEHNSKTYTKYTKNDAIYWYQPTDNKLFTDAWVEVVTFDLTEYTKATEKASIFTEEGNYIFEISLYEDDSKLTSASGKIKVKAEQVKIDDNMVTPYIPIFDELMQDVETALGDIEDKITEVNTAITQTNNLDLDVFKSGKVATVTLTKKDNTTKTVTLSDGTSLQFNWDGTKLGVKTDNDESYTYVDLKGETGETGATPSLSIGTVSTGSPSAVTITGTDENPVLNFTLEKGETGATGATGNGIASITKISSVDTTDTYRITFTDGTTYDYEITNGEVSQAQLDELQAQVDRYKMLENALPHVTGSGESVALNNTANAGMTIDLEPSELSQDEEPTPDNPQDIHVVTGDNSVKVENKNFLTTTLEDGSIWADDGTNRNLANTVRTPGYIDISSSTTWTFSRITDTTNIKCRYYDKNYNYLGTNPQIGAVLSYTINKPENAKYLRLTLDTANTNYFIDYKCQLEKGSTVTDYVEHQEQVVNIPLGDLEVCEIPNSDYKDKFVLNINSNNLFDKTTITTGKMINKNTGNPDNDTGTNCSDYIDVSKFANVILSGATISYSNGGAFYDKNKNYISGFSSTNIKNGLAIVENAVYLRFNILPVDVDTTMLNKGITALPYEPHTDNKWYLKKNIGKVVLDGSETDWNYNSVNEVFVKPFDNYNIENNIPYSNYYLGQQIVSAYSQVQDKSIALMSNGIRLFIKNTDYNRASDFQAWLSTHNTEVYYVLATPQYIPLNDTLQEQLTKIHNMLLSYKGQTNITQVNNDLPFDIVASALKDISNL